MPTAMSRRRGQVANLSVTGYLIVIGLKLPQESTWAALILRIAWPQGSWQAHLQVVARRCCGAPLFG